MSLLFIYLIKNGYKENARKRRRVSLSKIKLNQNDLLSTYHKCHQQVFERGAEAR
jgi:hypothetical protein